MIKGQSPPFINLYTSIKDHGNCLPISSRHRMIFSENSSADQLLGCLVRFILGEIRSSELRESHKLFDVVAHDAGAVSGESVFAEFSASSFGMSVFEDIA